MAAAVLTDVSPLAGDPGVELTLTGSDFDPGAAVAFTDAAGTTRNSPSVTFDSAVQIRATVPAFQGLQTGLEVKVENPGVNPSDAKSFSLNAYPPVASGLPLCGVARVKQFLGTDPKNTGGDDQWLGLIEAASRQITGYCSRSFGVVETVVDELLDGDGSELLRTKQSPIVSVASLTIDDDVVDPAEYFVYDEYVKMPRTEQYSARLRSRGRVFAKGAQNIKISYTAGYPEVPAEIADACVMQVIYLRNVGPRMGQRNESTEQVKNSVSWLHVGLAPQVRVIANRYRRQRIAVV